MFDKDRARFLAWPIIFDSRSTGNYDPLASTRKSPSMRVRLHSLLRPIRFGLLSDTSTPEGVLQAIKVNSFLWGGSFNPVIPAVDLVPALWADRDVVGQDWTAESLLDGFLHAFDPDALVVFPGANLHGRDLSAWQQASPEDIMRTQHTMAQSRYGVTIFEAARALVEHEEREPDRDPLHLVQPRLPDEWRMLEALLYGIEPDDFDHLLDQAVGTSIRVERQAASLEACLEFLVPNMLSVRRLGGYDLSHRRRPTSFYLFDAQDHEQVLDFLALRAQNHNLIPITVQATESERFLNSVRALQADARALFFISLAIPQATWGEHIARLALPNPSIQPRNFLTPFSRGKRIWARIGVERSASLPIEDGGVTIQLDQPFGGNFDDGFGGLLYASDVGLWWYDAKRLPPNAIPAGIRTVWSPSTYYHMMHGRISSGGITFYNHLGGEETFPLPDATAIVRDQYRLKGWSATPSDEGLRASQALSFIGGVLNAWWVMNNAAFEVLTSADIGSAGDIGAKNWYIALKKKKMQEGEIEGVTRALLDMDILTVGLQFKCTTCNRSPWYPLRESAMSVECTFCRGMVKPPAESAKALQESWTYRLQRPLDDPRHRSNLFGIFAAAGYFVHVRGDEVTVSLGLDLTKGDLKSEIDLSVLMAERGAEFGSDPTQIFVEAKGIAAKFGESDIGSFTRLLGDFPKAAFFFTTLRSELTDEEKVLITDFAALNGAQHSVGVLTPYEMMEHRNFNDQYLNSVNHGAIYQVCELTRERYLQVVVPPV